MDQNAQGHAAVPVWWPFGWWTRIVLPKAEWYLGISDMFSWCNTTFFISIFLLFCICCVWLIAYLARINLNKGKRRQRLVSWNRGSMKKVMFAYRVQLKNSNDTPPFHAPEVCCFCLFSTCRARTVCKHWSLCYFCYLTVPLNHTDYLLNAVFYDLWSKWSDHPH